MARARSPFLSLSASGSIGKTVTAAPWRGVKTLREYSKPANPRTTLQVATRGTFADAVSAWRTYFTNATTRSGWSTAVSVARKRSSGYNFALSAMTKITSSDPDASFCSAIAAGAALNATFTLLNADDGAAGDETGDFVIFAGPKPTSLSRAGTASLIAGAVTSPTLGVADAVVYVQLHKDNVPRSGIQPLTLIAAPVGDYVFVGVTNPAVAGSYFEDGTYGGYPKYKHATKDLYLYADGSLGFWVINDMGAYPSNCLLGGGDPSLAGPSGAYTSSGTYSGTGDVSVP